jgi:hypothetical protein
VLPPLLARRLGSALAGLAGLCEPAPDGLQVGQQELRLHRLDVTLWGHAPLDVHDVLLLKAAHHLDHGVGFADMCQELVAEPLASRGSAHQTRDVHQLQRSRHDPLGAHKRSQGLEPRVGRRDHAGVRVDGAERVVVGGRSRDRECIEQRALPHVGEADDPRPQCHATAKVEHLRQSASRHPAEASGPGALRCRAGEAFGV